MGGCLTWPAIGTSDEDWVTQSHSVTLVTGVQAAIFRGRRALHKATTAGMCKFSLAFAGWAFEPYLLSMNAFMISTFMADPLQFALEFVC